MEHWDNTWSTGITLGALAEMRILIGYILQRSYVSPFFLDEVLHNISNK